MILYRKKILCIKSLFDFYKCYKKKTLTNPVYKSTYFFLDVYDIYIPTKVKHHPVYIRILTINFKIFGPLLKNVNHLIIFSKVQ